METKKLILALCLLFLNYGISQTTVNTGIAVQGIARDNNNTQMANTTLTLTFEIYYTNGTPVSVYLQTASVATDAFGVFSYIMDVSAVDDSVFANQELYLKITFGTTVISNERLNHVPYAISASNGVPTGSIMPFIGATAPSGWLLCDGGAIPVNDGTKTLRDLLGSTVTPNLRGMFLRGAGTSPVNGRSGPGLGQSQNDDIEGHAHASGGLVTQTAGNHSHTTNLEVNDALVYVAAAGLSYENFERYNGAGRTVPTSAAGNHTHTITGNTANTGGLETRPVNFGVNYIIKL